MVKNTASPFGKDPIELDSVYRFEAICVSVISAIASLFFLKRKFTVRFTFFSFYLDAYLQNTALLVYYDTLQIGSPQLNLT